MSNATFSGSSRMPMSITQMIDEGTSVFAAYHIGATMSSLARTQPEPSVEDKSAGTNEITGHIIQLLARAMFVRPDCPLTELKRFLNDNRFRSAHEWFKMAEEQFDQYLAGLEGDDAAESYDESRKAEVMLGWLQPNSAAQSNEVWLSSDEILHRKGFGDINV